MSPTLDDVSRLDVQAILSATKGCLSVPSHVRRLKDTLTHFVIDNMSPELSANIGALLAARDNGRTGRSSQQKRRRQEVDPPPRKVARVTLDDEECKTNEFLELPSDDVIRNCYRQFYEATSNSALKMVVCAVCGRERDHHPDNVVAFHLQDIPSPSRLFPSSPHDQQTLFNGMLLEPHGMSTIDGCTTVNVCGECLMDLRKDSPLPPKILPRQWTLGWSYPNRAQFFDVPGAAPHCAPVSSGLCLQVVPEVWRGSCSRATARDARQRQHLRTERQRSSRDGGGSADATPAIRSGLLDCDHIYRRGSTSSKMATINVSCPTLPCRPCSGVVEDQQPHLLRRDRNLTIQTVGSPRRRHPR